VGAANAGVGRNMAKHAGGISRLSRFLCLCTAGYIGLIASGAVAATTQAPSVPVAPQASTGAAPKAQTAAVKPKPVQKPRASAKAKAKAKGKNTAAATAPQLARASGDPQALPVSTPTTPDAGISSAKSSAPKSQLSLAPRDFQSYSVGGRTVPVQVFRAKAQNALTPGARAPGAPAPAVILLHGASGLGSGYMIYPYAKALAERGINAFVVQYFDGVAGGRKAKASRALWDNRDRVIIEALNQVEDLPYVDRAKIGLFGVSLGGFHALGLGARDSRVAAIVNVFGAMPQVVANGGVRRMPPTLILHGDKDRIVPVKNAYTLSGMLDRLGTQHEMKIYPGQGHVFKGSAYSDSVLRTADFFERQLAAPQVGPSY